MNVVQISDSHISHYGGPPTDNFRKIAALVNDVLRPDIVVHTGDLSLLDPDSAADRNAAGELLALIDAPMLVLPGNHDVGEPGPAAWAGIETTSTRIAAFTAVFGPDHWVKVVAGYALVGIDSELLGTSTPEEQAQWRWLAEVPEQVAGRPTLVFTHKPLWPPVADSDVPGLAIPPATQAPLLHALGALPVVAYCSGHLHHYVVGRYGRAVTVAAPSTGFVFHGGEAAVGPGLRQLGVVEYRCQDGGVRPYFRAVPQLVEKRPAELDVFGRALEDMGFSPDQLPG